jgi:hypothetical protein
VLDLSDNRLQGEILPSLACTALRMLDLAYNRLNDAASRLSTNPTHSSMLDSSMSLRSAGNSVSSDTWYPTSLPTTSQAGA